MASKVRLTIQPSEQTVETDRLPRSCRLKKAHPNVNSFYKRLLVQSLATKNSGELRDGWLYLAKLCQEEKVVAGKAILSNLDVNGDDQPVSTQVS
jgi:hypothetical protein